MAVQHHPLSADTDVCGLACRLRPLAVDGLLVGLAAVASFIVHGWLAEAIVWLALALALTWRPR